MQAVAPQSRRLWLNGLLFAATVFTTLLAGARYTARGPEDLVSWEGLAQGFGYAGPLLLILLAHELGHYLAARRHGVDVSLPYFIPAPPEPFLLGTFGAFIRIQGKVPDRNALLDVGAAGPIAGLVVALPVLAIGLSLSEVRPLPQGVVGLQEGDSLLYLCAKWLFVGDIPPGHDVFLHPAAFAGWLGLFVTCLNLIPVGQMDGGHIAYALLGDRAGVLSRYLPFALAVLGVFAWPGWLLWAALLLLFGVGHPPLGRFEALDRRRLRLGALSAVLLIATFVPQPLKVSGGGPSAAPPSATGSAPRGPQARVDLAPHDRGDLVAGSRRASPSNGTCALPVSGRQPPRLAVGGGVSRGATDRRPGARRLALVHRVRGVARYEARDRETTLRAAGEGALVFPSEVSGRVAP